MPSAPRGFGPGLAQLTLLSVVLNPRRRRGLASLSLQYCRHNRSIEPLGARRVGSKPHQQVLADLKGIGGTVVSTSFDHTKEDRLKAALAPVVPAS